MRNTCDIKELSRLLLVVLAFDCFGLFGIGAAHHLLQLIYQAIVSPISLVGRQEQESTRAECIWD